MLGECFVAEPAYFNIGMITYNRARHDHYRQCDSSTLLHIYMNNDGNK